MILPVLWLWRPCDGTVTNEASFEPAFINQSADITFSGVDIGRSFSAGGDFNGDGFEDLILAGNGTSNKGEVIVIFGQANGFQHLLI